MAFCPNCGAAVEGQYCPKCGANVGVAPSPVTPVRPTAAGLTNNIAGALCYVPIIGGIIFLILEPYKNDRTVRFHAFQGIFLGIALIVIGYILDILLQISLNLYWTIHSLYRLASLILCLFLAFKAFQNQKVVLPVIGPLAEKQAGSV